MSDSPFRQKPGNSPAVIPGTAVLAVLVLSAGRPRHGPLVLDLTPMKPTIGNSRDAPTGRGFDHPLSSPG